MPCTASRTAGALSSVLRLLRSVRPPCFLRTPLAEPWQESSQGILLFFSLHPPHGHTQLAIRCLARGASYLASRCVAVCRRRVGPAPGLSTDVEAEVAQSSLVELLRSIPNHEAGADSPEQVSCSFPQVHERGAGTTGQDAMPGEHQARPWVPKLPKSQAQCLAHAECDGSAPRPARPPA